MEETPRVLELVQIFETIPSRSLYTGRPPVGITYISFSPDFQFEMVYNFNYDPLENFRFFITLNYRYYQA